MSIHRKQPQKDQCDLDQVMEAFCNCQLPKYHSLKYKKKCALVAISGLAR